MAATGVVLGSFALVVESLAFLLFWHQSEFCTDPTMTYWMLWPVQACRLYATYAVILTVPVLGFTWLLGLGAKLGWRNKQRRSPPD